MHWHLLVLHALILSVVDSFPILPRSIFERELSKSTVGLDLITLIEDGQIQAPTASASPTAALSTQSLAAAGTTKEFQPDSDSTLALPEATLAADSNTIAGKSTISYDLVTQINDGQIQAPARSTTQAPVASSSTPISIPISVSATTSSALTLPKASSPATSSALSTAPETTSLSINTSSQSGSKTLDATVSTVPLVPAETLPPVGLAVSSLAVLSLAVSSLALSSLALSSLAVSSLASVTLAVSSLAVLSLAVLSLAPVTLAVISLAPLESAQATLDATKSTISYGLVTQINDGQIQAPYNPKVDEGLTAPAQVIPLTLTLSLQVPETTSATLAGTASTVSSSIVHDDNTATTLKAQASIVPTAAPVLAPSMPATSLAVPVLPSSSIAIVPSDKPLTTLAPTESIVNPSESLIPSVSETKPTQSIIPTDTQDSIPVTSASSASPAASNPTLITSMASSSTIAATIAGKSTVSFDLITQINDGQIQAPYNPTLDSGLTASLFVSLTLSMILPTASPLATLAAQMSQVLPLVSGNASPEIAKPSTEASSKSFFETLAGNSSETPTEGSGGLSDILSDLLGTTQSAATKAAGSSAVPQKTALPSEDVTIAPSITSAPTIAPSATLAAQKSTASLNLVTQINDGQIQAPIS